MIYHAGLSLVEISLSTKLVLYEQKSLKVKCLKIFNFNKTIAQVINLNVNFRVVCVYEMYKNSSTISISDSHTHTDKIAPYLFDTNRSVEFSKRFFRM